MSASVAQNKAQAVDIDLFSESQNYEPAKPTQAGSHSHPNSNNFNGRANQIGMGYNGTMDLSLGVAVNPVNNPVPQQQKPNNGMSGFGVGVMGGQMGGMPGAFSAGNQFPGQNPMMGMMPGQMGMSGFGVQPNHSWELTNRAPWE